MGLLKNNGPAMKLRLIAALLMLVLGFIGVIVTDIKKDGAWEYWRFLCVIYALISVLLSWSLRKKGWKSTVLTIWHEIAHWAGLVAVIFICSYFVRIGLISRFEASFVTLLLLALTTYLAGIYTEPTLILIGIVLGSFAAMLGFLDEYLYNVLLPITVIAAVLLFVFIHHAHNKLTKM
ncbi:MAG: hypothetical protein HYX67_15750 [Candidatus Melainabacteria bacterium]|nr:hypothetical protein [Candidatus Melainabacteria bacterium]